jgi:hypothetical protein
MKKSLVPIGQRLDKSGVAMHASVPTGKDGGTSGCGLFASFFH